MVIPRRLYLCSACGGEHTFRMEGLTMTYTERHRKDCANAALAALFRADLERRLRAAACPSAPDAP
jgi:hypothetical protein